MLICKIPKQRSTGNHKYFHIFQLVVAKSGSRRVSVDASVAKLESQLIGERVRVAVTLGERQAIVIPSDYITVRSGIDYVSLKQGDDKTIEVPVQRGALIALADMENGIEILSGLKPGDVLVKP